MLSDQEIADQWYDFSEITTEYYMGTDEETFWRNWYYFGFKKAIHRHFEKWCSLNYGAIWYTRHRNKDAVRQYNFVLFQLPWYAKCMSRIERRLRDWVYPLKKAV